MKYPYCKMVIKAEAIKVETVGGGKYGFYTKVFSCPKCQTILGFGKAK